MFRRVTQWWFKIAGFHRSDDETGAGTLADFILPKMRVGFFIRMGVVALLSVLVFGFVLMPCVIDGESMMPTYPRHGFTFCWKWRYLFDEPEIGDIVILRYADRVYFLKRIIGLPGDTIEFRNGDLYRNGELVHEPYLRYASNWNLPPRKVEPGHYYVVGDNRSQWIDEHMFGQVLKNKSVGSPIW